MPIRLQTNRLRRQLRDAVDACLPSDTPIGDVAAIEQDWLPDLPTDYCHRCGITAGPGAVTECGCSHCFNQKLPWDNLIRLSTYNHPVESWVHQFKFNQAWQWGEWFGQQLASVVPDQPGQHLVTHVPLHRTRRWRRGYDQAQLIARRFASDKRWQHASIIKRTRPTQSQSSLRSQAERTRNIHKAFDIKNADLSGRHVWLIDDVKTTGSTLKQCAQLLRRRGASKLTVAVIAVADPITQVRIPSGPVAGEDLD